MSETEQVCCICNNESDCCNSDLIKVTDKGVNTLFASCVQRKDGNARKIIENKRKNEEAVFVHSDCRKIYADPKRLVTLKRKLDCDKSVINKKKVTFIEINGLF